jgi:hypothetical protein
MTDICNSKVAESSEQASSFLSKLRPSTTLGPRNPRVYKYFLIRYAKCVSTKGSAINTGGPRVSAWHTVHDPSVSVGTTNIALCNIMTASNQCVISRAGRN